MFDKHEIMRFNLYKTHFVFDLQLNWSIMLNRSIHLISPISFIDYKDIISQREVFTVNLKARKKISGRYLGDWKTNH